jgi:hypothetical protein
MLKKLIDALVAAGLIQATDPEEAVLIKLGQLKEEMNWKREEMARQSAEAARLKAMLPAANVAGLEDAGEDVPLLSEALITVAGNSITELRDLVEAANARETALKEALVNASIEKLLSANEITGADVDSVRETLVACANAEAMAEAMQGLCKGGAGAKERVTKDLAGAKEKVVASNDAGAKSRERTELVNAHLARITKGGSAKPGMWEMAWNSAMREKPELFEA